MLSVMTFSARKKKPGCKAGQKTYLRRKPGSKKKVRVTCPKKGKKRASPKKTAKRKKPCTSAASIKKKIKSLKKQLKSKAVKSCGKKKGKGKGKKSGGKCATKNAVKTGQRTHQGKTIWVATSGVKKGQVFICYRNKRFYLLGCDDPRYGQPGQYRNYGPCLGDINRPFDCKKSKKSKDYCVGRGMRDPATRMMMPRAERLAGFYAERPGWPQDTGAYLSRDIFSKLRPRRRAAPAPAFAPGAGAGVAGF